MLNFIMNCVISTTLQIEIQNYTVTDPAKCKQGGLTQTNVMHSHKEFITLQPINFIPHAYQCLFSL